MGNDEDFFDRIFWYLASLALVLPFILLYIGAYLPIVLDLGIQLYHYWIIALPIAFLASTILWWKKKKFLATMMFIIILDLVILGFLVYVIGAIISEY